MEQMDLIYSLIGYPAETEWLEFKSNLNDPEKLGKDISALANSAAYLGRDYAYKVWGVDDKDHSLVGTSYDPYTVKKGNQDLLIWLKRMLSNNANYSFSTIENDGKRFVVLKICAASRQPVYFSNTAYIRAGSNTTPLTTGSALEAALWHRLDKTNFESLVAKEALALSDVFQLLDVDTYFTLTRMPRPITPEALITPLLEQDILRRADDGSYSITNLGALLLARNLNDFPTLQKRILRVLRFKGKSNFDILDDRRFEAGYAISLNEAESYISAITPSEEVTDGAMRIIKRAFPKRAVRELLSNVVIHQDLSDATSGPLVGVYENRIEFTNPGISLIPTDRFLNAPPKSRNSKLVNQLRLMDLCEEGGTGWDLVIASCEEMHLAAPKILSSEEIGTKVTLFSEIAYTHMSKQERIDALYWHTCLMYANGESMSNQTARERFGLTDERKDLLAMSRLIRECCENGVIKEEDESAGAKYKRYIPYWA